MPVSSPARRAVATSSSGTSAIRARYRGAPIVLVGLTALVVFAVVLGVSAGPVAVPFEETVRVILGDRSPLSSSVIEQIRLPRVLVALFVGASLAVAGAVMQAIFRNPLAEPGVLGVSSGAAASAVLVIASGATAWVAWVLPAAAFVGAVGALTLVYAIAALRRDRSPAMLLLVGIALSALFGAVVSVVVTNTPDDDALRGVVFWLNGDLVARTWEHVRIIVAPATAAIAGTLLFGRDLNVMLLGEAQALASGVDVVRTRRVLLLLAAVLTGVSVSVAGVIGFVGLVVPHLLRLVVGPDHRILIPGSALLGGAFLVLADVAARMMFSPVSLQTGTVTALLGAPVFLFLVLRRRREFRS